MNPKPPQHDNFPPPNPAPNPISSPPSWTLQPAEPIPDAVLRAVHASDQAMYPVDLPYSRLRAWVDAAPDLSVYYYHSHPPGRELDADRLRDAGVRDAEEAPSIPSDGDDGVRDGDERANGTGNPAGREAAAATDVGVSRGGGVVVVLPLRRRHWGDLLAGRLKEAEIDPESMFARASGGGRSEIGIGIEIEEEEVGLHVYHIERFGDGFGDVGDVRRVYRGEGDTSGRERLRFSEIALAEVVRRARAKPGWKILGMSALTATLAGKKTFQRLGFKPTGYQEVFVARASSDSSSVGLEDRKQADMVCIFPGVEAKLGDAMILSTSEMVVKYKLPSDLGCIITDTL